MNYRMNVNCYKLINVHSEHNTMIKERNWKYKKEKKRKYTKEKQLKKSDNILNII